MSVLWRFIVVALAVGCGRTELVRFEPDASVPVALDAGRDAGARDAGPDAGPDAGVDGGFQPKPCVDGTFTLSPAEPVVMMVLDRSCSMDMVFTNGQTRWEALVTSLEAALPSVDQTMQLGGLAYPPNAADSCTVAPGAGIWPSRGNVAQILSNLRSVLPNGATPTTAALQVAGQVLRTRRASSTARAMVLATDGQPSCTTDPLDDALIELRRAANDGIPTYVIGIADDQFLSRSLDQMAVAGGRPRSGAQAYYSAQSAAELRLAFETVRDQVGACSFLTDSVPDTRGSIRVTFDGVELTFDETGRDGWRWTDRPNGEIALVGQSCSRAIARPAGLVVTVACGAP